MSQVVRVAVTGAAGQVAYAMLARLAAGDIFGKDKKVILHLLEIPQAMQSLEGVVMELIWARPTWKASSSPMTPTRHSRA